MSVIVNPGSDIPDPVSGEGWTNTYGGALAQAWEWHARMVAEGLGHDVELLRPGRPCKGDSARWRFEFRHKVTGVVVALDTHGISDIEKYRKSHVFYPRVYWNGSSSGEPELEDFAEKGFEPYQSFRPVED